MADCLCAILYRHHRKRFCQNSLHVLDDLWQDFYISCNFQTRKLTQCKTSGHNGCLQFCHLDSGSYYTRRFCLAHGATLNLILHSGWAWHGDKGLGQIACTIQDLAILVVSNATLKIKNMKNKSDFCGLLEKQAGFLFTSKFCWFHERGIQAGKYKLEILTHLVVTSFLCVSPTWTEL